jgi:regulatory protein
VAELRGVLERKLIDPAAIDEAVRELTEARLLDDDSYARRFAEDKRELEQWGGERIARELRRRGVAPSRIEAALETYGPESELGAALVVLRRRLPQAPRDDRERDRAWRLLVRRGYASELAYEAVRVHEREAAEAA